MSLAGCPDWPGVQFLLLDPENEESDVIPEQQYDAAQRTAETADHSMFKSLTINNFRCFSDVKVGGLRRVNIVVGKNATGKTVLLESLFLSAGGSPVVVLKLRAMRGMGNQVSVDNLTQSRLWEDLFCGVVTTKPIQIEAIGSHSDSRSLLITNVGVASLTVGTKEQPEAAADAPIEFIWRGDGQPDFVTRPKISAKGLQFDNAPSAVKAVMFPANFSLDPEETSKRLSDIRRKNQLSFLLDTLQTVFPDITDVSVENNAGVWMVYVSTTQITSQMIPMALHSAGMNRFVAILLGIASVPRGVVLIDELENGLYYKTLPNVWRAIHTFAQQYKTQVFATTHSMECLSAVRDVVHTAHDDFSLIRATSENGERWLDLFSGDKLDGALESGFELR